MIQFFAPVFLLGIFATLIPVVIHLWNTKDQRVIKVGSIRWLMESETVRMSRIQLSELFLLILRIVLVLLFVFLLSELRSSLFSDKPESSNWVLVDPEVEDVEEVLGALDKPEGWELRWLYSDFPSADDPVEISTKLDYWQLLSELDLADHRPDSLIIYSSSKYRHFQGERPSLSMNVEWVVLPDDLKNDETILAYQLADSLSFYKAKYVSLNLIPGKVDDVAADLSSVQIYPVRTLQVKIVGNADSWEYQNLTAALGAINSIGLGNLELDSAAGEPEVVFNLTGNSEEGTLLTFDRSPDADEGEMIVKDQTIAKKYLICQPLTIDNMVRYEFVKKLYTLLTPSFDEMVLVKSDLQLSPDQATPKSKAVEETRKAVALANLSAPLWMLLVGLLLLERILSYYKKQ